MRRVLATDRGHELYAQRQVLVEPVFGQIKHNRGAARFARRGRSAVRSEWRLLAATNNLLKLWRHTTAPAAGLTASSAAIGACASLNRPPAGTRVFRGMPAAHDFARLPPCEAGVPLAILRSRFAECCSPPKREGLARAVVVRAVVVSDAGSVQRSSSR
jgi:hypothetical protein